MKKIVNKISLTCFSFACLILMPACDNKLDIQPIDTIDAGAALSTSTDVEALLVGAYDRLGDDDIFGGNILRDSELLGDNGEISWIGTYEQPREIYSKRILTNNTQVEDTWSDCYETINVVNNVLANLALVDEDKREQVEGEAKFIRALTYFELVRLFARPWNDETDNPATNPGVPLVLTPTELITEANDVPRNTVAEVYQQVILDLTEAVELLPATNGFFATQGAANAVLARVYLTQENYADAAASADKVIASNQYSLVNIYANTFNNSTNTSEDIFAIQVTSQDGANSMNEFFGSTGNLGRGDILIEDTHLALYSFLDFTPIKDTTIAGFFTIRTLRTINQKVEEVDSVVVDSKRVKAGTKIRDYDDRYYFFYNEGGDRFTSKWTNKFGNLKVIRLAEMYLIRAEANFRNNSSIGASPSEDINTVRARANLGPLQAVTLAEILLERRKELAFEGHRLHDVKRTKSTVDNIAYNSPRLIFPIPQREVDVNTKLVQNDGY